MTTPFFLIDFENVQPKALGRLQPGTYLARVLATDAAGNRSRGVTVRFRVAAPART